MASTRKPIFFATAPICMARLLSEATPWSIVWSQVFVWMERGLFACAHRRAIKKQFALAGVRSEEHTSELQSRLHLVCRLLLEKKKKTSSSLISTPSHSSCVNSSTSSFSTLVFPRISSGSAHGLLLCSARRRRKLLTHPPLCPH